MFILFCLTYPQAQSRMDTILGKERELVIRQWCFQLSQGNVTEVWKKNFSKQKSSVIHFMNAMHPFCGGRGGEGDGWEWENQTNRDSVASPQRLKNLALEGLGKCRNISRRPNSRMGKRQPWRARIHLELLKIDELTKIKIGELETNKERAVCCPCGFKVWELATVSGWPAVVPPIRWEQLVVLMSGERIRSEAWEGFLSSETAPHVWASRWCVKTWRKSSYRTKLGTAGRILSNMVSRFLRRPLMVRPELCVEGSVDPTGDTADALAREGPETGAPWQARREVLEVLRGSKTQSLLSRPLAV